MEDYKKSYTGERSKNLIQNEQIFINYLNCAIGKESNVKNSYANELK